MKRVVLLVALVGIGVPRAEAQGGYGQTQSSFRFTGDAMLRYEWTRKIPGPEGLIDESRWRVQARPRLELDLGFIGFGVGGDFNYSKDENDKAPEGETLLIVRDNYRSRDARLDLYWGRIKLGPVVAEGGRFFMPLPLTEMIWDRDLRPEGGSLGLELGPRGSANRFALTGIWAKGSHIFPDDSQMFGGSVALTVQGGGQSQVQLAGSYLEYRDLDTLDPVLRRQNTRLEDLLLDSYKVIDVQGRIVAGGQLPFQLVADYCWNRALDEDNKGLWLAVKLGELEISRARLEYTYAKIDRDAVVGAFNTDDFYWNTGVEAHRAELGSATGRGSSLHAIAQWQRFKDSPDPEVRDQWVERYRLEWRYSF